MTEHQLAMKIIKILIESGLSVSDQLEVIKSVQKRLEFCKLTAHRMAQKQTKLEL